MDKRPKLLIVGGPHVSADEVAASLSERFDVVDGSGADTPGEPVEAVLVDAERFPMLAAELANERAMTLLNAIGEGVCLASSDGAVLWGNQFFRDLDEGVRSRVIDACRSSVGRFAEFAKKAAQEAKLAKCEAARPAPCRFEIEDEERHFEVEVAPVPAGGNEEDTGQVAAVVRDVTEARRLRAKMVAIDRAGGDLVHFGAGDIRDLNSYERMGMLEGKIKHHAKELLDFDHFVIFLTDDKSGKLEPVITQGLPREIEELDLYSGQEGSGISGHVASTGQTYVCHDALTDERFLPGLSGARSSLTVPLKIGDRVIGIMDVESQQPEAFGDEEQQLAEMFARSIATALHMLDLLVAERSTTNESVSGRVRGEIDEPLEDIVSEADWISGRIDPEVAEHISKIKQDVESIRRRMQDVTEGPQTLLGVERAMHVREEDPAFRGRRVLVADDAQKIRKVIGDVLRKRGCDVTMCENGGEAVERLNEVGAGQIATYDIVISDIKMPDRNGYEVFAAARKHAPGVSVILMTGFGYDPHHSIVRASQEGLQSVLFKPFQIEQLIEQVREVFEGSPAAE